VLVVDLIATIRMYDRMLAGSQFTVLAISLHASSPESKYAEASCAAQINPLVSHSRYPIKAYLPFMADYIHDLTPTSP
jgi:hypothetical protein